MENKYRYLSPEWSPRLTRPRGRGSNTSLILKLAKGGARWEPSVLSTFEKKEGKSVHCLRKLRKTKGGGGNGGTRVSAGC